MSGTTLSLVSTKLPAEGRSRPATDRLPAGLALPVVGALSAGLWIGMIALVRIVAGV